MQKAQRSLKTAQLAFQDGDMDGACNRAYYAMFSAARASLLHSGHEDSALAKTHSGLISAVGKHLVVAGHLSAEHGRALSEISRIRIAADYLGTPISGRDAQAALKKAGDFLTAVSTFLTQPPPPLLPPAQKQSKGKRR